jgi:hypothetical protein
LDALQQSSGFPVVPIGFRLAACRQPLWRARQLAFPNWNVVWDGYGENACKRGGCIEFATAERIAAVVDADFLGVCGHCWNVGGDFLTAWGDF